MALPVFTGTRTGGTTVCNGLLIPDQHGSSNRKIASGADLGLLVSPPMRRETYPLSTCSQAGCVPIIWQRGNQRIERHEKWANEGRNRRRNPKLHHQVRTGIHGSRAGGCA